MEEILSYSFWGNSLKEYLISLVAFVITIFVLKLFKNIGVFRLKKLANRTQIEIVFDVVYYVLTPDYNRYMDIQQEINFAIKERFEEEKIEFAYPTQTIFVDKVK